MATGYQEQTGQFIIPWAGGVPYGEQAANINKFMNSQALNQFNQNLPGYANAVGQRMENNQQMLEGRLPQDVINQIAQQSAERGIGTGGAGRPNANAAYLSALGLNSLQLQQQGSQGLSQAIADAPIPELFNPASLWVPTVLGQQESQAALAQLKASKPPTSSYYTGPTTGRNPPGGFGSTLGAFNFEDAFQDRFGRPSYSFL